MTAREVLGEIERVGGHLRVNARGRIAGKPAHLMTPERMTQIRAVEHELRQLLLRRQRANDQLQQSSAVEQPSAAATLACWRCGAGPTAPDLDTQIEMLQRAHRGRGEIFDWPPREWTRLRKLLQEGDVLVVIKNVFLMTDPDYGGVWVERGDRLLTIDRRALMDS